MNKYKRYRVIAELISKEISGEIAPVEQQELSSWINELPENKALYHRIKNAENFRKRNEEYRQIDIFTGWDHLNRKIERTSAIIKRRTIFKYAAAIMIPLVVAGILFKYLSRQEKEVSPVARITEILPGKPQAVLVLNNGKSVALDSSGQLSIAEKDGTLIEKNTHGLNYSVNVPKAPKENLYNTVKIPRGGEYELVLADGTRVYLNAESQLRYPVQFLENTREVELTGEAYFDVAKDPHKPFVVKTTGMSVEVLGTTFNLSAYGNTEKILTTLVEGSIKINIAASQETRLLQPDEQASVDLKSGLTEVRTVDVSLYTDWKSGRLNFFDNRLEDIMITLTRWYSAEVIYMNPSVKDFRFSGSLNRYDDIRQFLDIISSTGKVKIEIKGNTILFSE
ncbi:MAG: FecR family protein [Mangrovibacterium sp.]